MKKPPSRPAQNSGDAVSRRDHLFATDRVEQVSKDYRAKHVAKRKWQKIATDTLFGHAVKPHQDERVRKKDRVVEKRLRQHQDETEKGPTSVFVDDRFPNFSPRRVRSSLDPCWRGIMCRQRFRIRYESALDLTDNLFRFGVSSVNHQPARAFRDPPAKENHNEAECRTDRKRKSPA